MSRHVPGYMDLHNLVSAQVAIAIDTVTSYTEYGPRHPSSAEVWPRAADILAIVRGEPVRGMIRRIREIGRGDVELEVRGHLDSSGHVDLVDRGLLALLTVALDEADPQVARWWVRLADEHAREKQPFMAVRPASRSAAVEAVRRVVCRGAV